MGVVFSYQYRDGDNYKNSGEVIFSGECSEEVIKKLDARLREAFDEDEYFIASQIGIPEVFLYEAGGYEVDESDHCWHEFTGLEAAMDSDIETDSRTIEEFIAEVEAASKAGWEITDPGGDSPGPR